MTPTEDAPFTDAAPHSDADVVEIARRLLRDGSIPSRNSAFASYRDPAFAKGVRLARQIRDLAGAIAAMKSRGTDARIEERSDGWCIHTVLETRAGPVTRISYLPPGAPALLETLAATRRSEGPRADPTISPTRP
jgi:hypothetical protein